MTKTTRYQVTDVISKRGKCRTHTGVDPVTGLPVLIYIFEGRPRVTVGRLEADNIPSILAARFNSEKNKGQVVVAHSEERQQVSQVANQDEARLLLLDTAKALAAAAHTKVVHGDIHPGRFWVEAGRYCLEGYGVNWHGQDERFSPPEHVVSLQGDVFSWAQSVYDLAGHVMPRAMTKLVATCLVDDPEQRPTAVSLLEQLSNLANDSTSTNRQTFNTTNPPAPANTSSADAKTSARFDMNEDDFDLDFKDDDTATFAAANTSNADKVSADATKAASSNPNPNSSNPNVTSTQTETHAPTESAVRLADFDLSSFADDDDEEEAISTRNPVADYDFFAADETPASDTTNDGNNDGDNDGEVASEGFADDFSDVDFGNAASGEISKGYGDEVDINDINDIDAFADDDDDAFMADPFGRGGGFADEDSYEGSDEDGDGDANDDFESFEDDFADEPPAARNNDLVSSSAGLSDLSEIMSPATDPYSADTAASDQAIAKPNDKINDGDFIKGLPTGATVRTVESKKKAPASELPTSKQAKVYTPPSKRKKRRLGRQIGIFALVAALGVLVYIALDRYGVLDPPPPPNPVATFFPLTVNVRPTSIAQAQLVVVSSPEDSVHDAGDEMATVPARVFLDSEGTWQLRARFQDALSEVQTLTVPGPNVITFEIPVPEEDLEPPPN